MWGEVSNYVISLYGDKSQPDFIVVTILIYVEISNHYIVYQELTQCHRSIILQKQEYSWKKRSDLWLQVGGQWLDEDGQKAKTSSYKINKY